jgi:hypothetical protein
LRKRIGLSAIGAVLFVIAVLFAAGGVKLSDFTTQLAVGLALLIPLISAFMIKPEIDSWTNSRRKHKITATVAHQQAVGIHETASPQEPSDMQASVVDPIRHYSTRDELKFHHMLSIAHDSVEMLASTFTIVTEQYYDELVYVLAKGISFTFLLLDPESKETCKQRGLYHRSEDLRYQIRNSLKVLCDLKCEFPDNVVIKLYNARAPRSITIIDRENPDNAWIRVERRELDSVPNSRPSDAWYRREEERRFDNFLKEYDEVLGKSKIYDCPTTF